MNEANYKKEKIGTMLTELEEGMKNCLILAPSYHEKKLLHYVTELYIPDEVYLSMNQNFKIYQNFAKGYMLIKDKPEVQNMMKEVNEFRLELKAYSLSIRNLKDIEQTFVKDFEFYVKWSIFLSLFSLPFLMFYIPLKIILGKIVHKKRAQALKASEVKIKGNDVVQTTNVTYSIVLIPILVNFYGLFFWFFTRWFLNLNWFFAFRL